MVSRGRWRTHTLVEKSRARSSKWTGASYISWRPISPNGKICKIGPEKPKGSVQLRPMLQCGIDNDMRQLWFWPLLFRVSLSMRVLTTLTTFRFVFYQNINVKENVFFLQSASKLSKITDPCNEVARQTGFKLIASAWALQCSTDWVTKLTQRPCVRIPLKPWKCFSG